MLRGGRLAIAILLFSGCALDPYDPGLPPVHPEGPAATALANAPSAEVARLHLAWMMAYQVNGHFDGYTDAEKVFASRTRASGVICKDDRDTRMQITYPDGLAGIPVHRGLVSCPEAYSGLPKPDEFGGAEKAELADAATALGMSCSDSGSLSTCRIDVSWINRALAVPETVTRNAILTIYATGKTQVAVEGFEGAS